MNGHLHPMTQFMRKSLKFFEERGFTIAEGPEIETEWKFLSDGCNAEHALLRFVFAK